jgi:2'-5' RNA ligase
MKGYQDYLVVLSPESVIAKVRDLKGQAFEKVGEYESHYSKAHITIQNWARKKPVWIEPLIPMLARDLKSLPPVTLQINGFDFFDHLDRPTIYARFKSTPLTSVWFKHLRKYFGISNFEPHITIARSIPTETFKKLWPHFKNLDWNEEITIDKLTILRRDTIGHDKSYHVFRELEFNRQLDFYQFAQSKLKPAAAPKKQVDEQQFSLF